MRFVCIIFLAIASAALLGCMRHSQAMAAGTSNSITVVDYSKLTGFQQQSEADMLIDFLDWDNIIIARPSLPSPTPPLDKESFLQAISKLEFERRLAVVVMDKRWSIAKQRVSLNELEAFMRSLGFKRVVFQQARSVLHLETGIPILRDTAEQQ